MQFLRNFTGLAIFILALAGVGMTTPLAAVSSHMYILKLKARLS